MSSEKQSIPVILITGFLGAGKTTFINQLIRTHNHLKFALIENEFGEVAVDSHLISGIQKNSLFELKNGCICCSVFNEFSLALRELKPAFRNIDFVLIETSGVANPAPLIRSFWADEAITCDYELAATVCVADTANFRKQSQLFEQQMQLIHADLVLLNKSDLADDDSMHACESEIAEINRTATRVSTREAFIPGFSLEYFTQTILSNTERILPQAVMYARQNTMKQVSIEIPFVVSMDQFRHWFDYFASVNQRAIYRIKGLIHPAGSMNYMVVQAVAGATSYQEGSLANPLQPDRQVMVFIGDQLDREAIEAEIFAYFSQE